MESTRRRLGHMASRPLGWRLRARNWDNGHLARCGMVALVGVAGLRARNWDNGHLARCGMARSPSGSLTSRARVGRAFASVRGDLGRRSPFPIDSLLVGRKAEAEIHLAPVGMGVLPIARRAVPGRVPPAAAPEHAAGLTQVLTPLRHVTVHIVETERIRFFPPYRP